MYIYSQLLHGHILASMHCMESTQLPDGQGIVHY